MYLLKYESLGRVKTAKFKDTQKIREVEDSTGNLVSFGLYEKLIETGVANGMDGTYKLNKIPTIKQLNDSWESFLKLGIYEDQRFGQWFYNDYEFEVGNSYNIERPYLAYQVLYAALVTTLDDVLENWYEHFKK